MMPLVRALLAFITSLFRACLSLQGEIGARRHPRTLDQRSIRRPQVRPPDRLFWAWLSRGWARWREVLIFVQPPTVRAWQRRRFRDHWARRNRRHPGRPTSSSELREGIRNISAANPRWGRRGCWVNCGSWGLPSRRPRSRDVPPVPTPTVFARLAGLCEAPYDRVCRPRFLHRPYG
jgi:hypothetical protein